MAEISNNKIENDCNSDSEYNSEDDYEDITETLCEKTLYEITNKYKCIHKIKKDIDRLSYIKRKHESDLRALMDKLPKNIQNELLLNQSLMDNPRHFIERVKMTKKLANFLGEDVNTYITADKAISLVREYVIENGLQDKEKIIKINPDEKLKELFGLTNNGGELSFLNIGKYVNEHLIKNETKSK